jgi:hypothetical protein
MTLRKVGQKLGSLIDSALEGLAKLRDEIIDIDIGVEALVFWGVVILIYFFWKWGKIKEEEMQQRAKERTKPTDDKESG